MVQIKDLANSPGDREIRERIFAKGETIKVFEPSRDDISKIFDLQEKFIDKSNPERLKLSGNDVIGLFKMLTDIEGLDDLSEEEMDAIIENPTMALIQAQYVIEGIVTEVYKMVILSMKNRVLESDLKLISAQTSQEVLERSLDLAKRSGDSKKYADKVDEAKAKVLEFKKAQNLNKGSVSVDTSQVNVEAVKEALSSKPAIQIEKYSNVLSQFKNTFNETESE